jgi:putative ABC transport system permease protein
MLAYYLRLGFLSLRRNPVLTALMVVTLAVGVAASMAALTVLYAMSGDPIPHKSDRLFVPLLDMRPDDGTDPEPEPPPQLGYNDVVALRNAGRGVRQTAMYMISPVIDSGRPDLPPWFGWGIAVHTDFFPMFDVPFIRGGPWTAEDDERAAHVVVLRESIAERVFGGEDPIGRTIRLGIDDHVVTGVVPDAWDPLPRFYRLIAGPGPFGGTEEVFLPFETAIAAELEQQGQRSCFGNAAVPKAASEFEVLKLAECSWIQLWVELESPADAPAYRDFLAGYVSEQRKLGRFPRPDNHRLYDVTEWLDVNQVVSKDSRLQTYLAFGFLLVCLVNTIALLLAKFTARSGEIGVRRALGASRRVVFQQYLIEAGVVGLAGGVVGLGLTYGFLKLLARQSDELALLARMDWVMLGTTFALAIAASLLAGLLPTWRACQVQPALQLKSQ